MAKLTIIVFLIMIPGWCYSQETILSDAIISIAEEIASDESDPESIAIYIEKLYELAEDPVHINSGNENELARLFFLTDFQVKILSDYVRSSGKIVSFYELANIPGFDTETAEMLIPFTILTNTESSGPKSSRLRSTLITNYTLNSVNDDTSFLGSSCKILTKYKLSSGPFTGCLTAEKDPGETFLPTPDFLSASFAYRGNGLIRKVIAGDYSARFGQGTNINTGIRTGLSLTSPGYMSASDEIKPYTSTDENNFFRGLATEFSIKKLSLIAYYSKNSTDATMGSSSGHFNDFIENFYQSGIHNTSSLLLKKDAISEVAFGMNVSYNFNKIRLGLTYSENHFSLPIIPSTVDTEKIYDFKGDRNSVYSIYYNSMIKKILLYGEFSLNRDIRHAFVQGISLRPSDRFTINFLFRDYDAGYFSLHGRGAGTGSSTANEQGILGNFTFEAARHLFISAGSNICNYPWLRYRSSSPSWGRREEIRIRYLPTRKLTIDGAYNHKVTTDDSPESLKISKQEESTTNSFRCSARYMLTENLVVGSRIDYKYAGPSGSKGMALLQEINYRFIQLPFTIWLRYCLFNTDSWDSRIYIYENDLLNSFSIPSLSGEGSRSYIMVKWDCGERADLRIKYGFTSTADNVTVNQNKDEIKLQVKVFF